MFHHARRSSGRPRTWVGLLLAGVALAMIGYLLVKGGGLVLVPFALAGAIAVSLLVFLRWLQEAGS